MPMDGRDPEISMVDGEGDGFLIDTIYRWWMVQSYRPPVGFPKKQKMVDKTMGDRNLPLENNNHKKDRLL